MRRIALGAGKRRELRALETELEALPQAPEHAEQRRELEVRIDELRERLGRIPFIDEVDIRYHRHVKEPIPHSKAVMFCLMDVSGSMDQRTKDLAKRFYILLYLFLSRNYDKTEVVFIRHHTSAKEVDEDEFFHSRETGGTLVSCALTLVDEIITAFPSGTVPPVETTTMRSAADMEPYLREPLSEGWKPAYALPRIGQDSAL